MDPVSAATAFATTVSLLADFVSHRDMNRAASLEEFMAWLSEHRHDQIKALLEQNTSTTITIKALLGESRREILDRLESLDRTLARFASGFDSYRGIALAAYPDSILSDQALTLLEELHDSDAGKFLLVEYIDGTRSMPIVDGSGGELTVSDSRFLNDDLQVLCEMGFLGMERAGRGERLYVFRRAGARFIERVRPRK